MHISRSMHGLRKYLMVSCGFLEHLCDDCGYHQQWIWPRCYVFVGFLSSRAVDLDAALPSSKQVSWMQQQIDGRTT